MVSESVLRLALAVHENRGADALLIGSGVSRAAGIPSGWDIVLDLIRKVAAVEKKKPQPDPEKWYQKRFGEAPGYAKLLKRLTATSPERMTLPGQRLPIPAGTALILRNDGARTGSGPPRQVETGPDVDAPHDVPDGAEVPPPPHGGGDLVLHAGGGGALPAIAGAQ